MTPQQLKIRSEYAKKWRSEHPKYGTGQSKKWFKKNKRRARLHQLAYNYGLTSDQFYVLLGSQNGLCALCGMVNDDGQALNVDHRHVENYEKLSRAEKAKLIRGLLCRPCNLFLGHCRDNAAIFEKKVRRMSENIHSYFGSFKLVKELL